MDKRLTDEIQAWLGQPPGERDVAAGALLLLRINRNQVLYRNIMLNPAAMAGKLEYELKKLLPYRLEVQTHDEVSAMEAKAEAIARRDFSNESNLAKDFKAGKREDHDSLPEDIQALYVENKGILQQMRDLHAQLRIIQAGRPGYTCKDSDKYPFLKELIRLDKLYRENWAKYDGWDAAAQAVVEVADARTENRRALAFINFNKGKYKAEPNEQLKTQLAVAYAKVMSPTDKLTKELTEMGIIA